ncbi:2'-5' RNA ligase family protein [Pyxidicoccus parkwayensis]|uniref:2'-5' RNA ligase family protein n=1 Tax=Pyxidicoccus parkwayensis TaxID=2813578 RepID=A0ABX7NWJ0_9BACT|nr:2'-5' RNA ligase family protein [Pyxidicoccus parkwaysis]QSQ23234.1 2'-5' RNA ligase family protein [Pyxidicoccus parkwaysis]
MLSALLVLVGLAGVLPGDARRAASALSRVRQEQLPWECTSVTVEELTRHARARRMQATRRQLTLFVPGPLAEEIEAVRHVVDPVQKRLIPAHVTLCREDELGGRSEGELDALLVAPHLKPVTLRFGEPEAFYEHGIVMYCIEGLEDFQALRQSILGAHGLKVHRPHLTLAHPRNPRAPGNALERAAGLRSLPPITFKTLCLIEQTAGSPWQVLRSVELSAS